MTFQEDATHSTTLNDGGRREVWTGEPRTECETFESMLRDFHIYPVSYCELLKGFNC